MWVLHCTLGRLSPEWLHVINSRYVGFIFIYRNLASDNTYIKIKRPFHANFAFKLEQSMERKAKISVIQNLNIWIIISLIIAYIRVIFHPFDSASGLNKLLDA